MNLQRRTPLKAKRDTPRRKGAPVPRIKSKPAKDPKHLKRVRALGCWCCKVDGLGWVKAEAHHPRKGQGMSTKASDHEAIGLCPGHHRGDGSGKLSVHLNPIEWRARYGTEAEVLAEILKELESQP